MNNNRCPAMKSLNGMIRSVKEVVLNRKAGSSSSEGFCDKCKVNPLAVLLVRLGGLSVREHSQLIK